MPAISVAMSPDPVLCHVDHTLAEAAHRMMRADIGLLLVVDGDELVGVVTDRDLVVRGAALGAFAPDMVQSTVADVMTRHVIACRADTDCAEAVRLMAAQRVRRLAVVDGDNELIGVVSLGDLARRPDAAADTAAALREISAPLDTAKTPAQEDPTGGHARKSPQGVPHVYGRKPRLRHRVP